MHTQDAPSKCTRAHERKAGWHPPQACSRGRRGGQRGGLAFQCFSFLRESEIAWHWATVEGGRDAAAGGGGAGRAGRSGEGLPPWELNGHLLGSPADVLPMPKGHSSAHFRGGTPPRMRGGRWDPTLLTVPLVPGAESFCLGGGAPTTLQESVPSQKALEARSGGPQRNGIPLPMPSGSATPLLRPQRYAVGRTGWEG